MKKVVSLLLIGIMSLMVFAGCGNPVYDDFDNFLNVEMKDVNANYDKIKVEAGKWENFEDDADLISSLKDILLPLAEDSLAKLEDINPETEEVKALKDKYVDMMESYKDGFEEVLDGLNEADENEILSGNEKLQKALTLLEEYNAALEELAEEVGGQIEY